MNTTIFLTGATDGIGLLTAKTLASKGYNLIIHGRNPDKLERVKQDVCALNNQITVETLVADLSSFHDISKLIESIRSRKLLIDTIINNAGILESPISNTKERLDIRFMVNAIALHMLSVSLAPLLVGTKRIINLSSAAQESIDLGALRGETELPAFHAYAQSKLLVIMTTRLLAERFPEVASIAVNPASLLGTKMVKEGFGIDGKDIRIGSDILCTLATSNEIDLTHSGAYFDNDIGKFNQPHTDALNEEISRKCIAELEAIIQTYNS